jgi:streptomycin 6-kinase
MTRVAVPEDVLSAVKEQWPARGEAWSRNVLAEFDQIARRYGAVFREIFKSRYGFVVGVDSPHGPLVIRGSADPLAAGQAAVVSALAAAGVGPQVREIQPTETGVWTVMDRVLPGDALADVGVTVADVVTLAETYRQVIGHVAPDPDLPSLTGWLHGRLVDDDLTDIPQWATVAPVDERRECLAILADLASDDRALCHGDLSGWNVLLGPDQRMFLIDPRGLRGDPAYDAALIAAKFGMRTGNFPDPLAAAAEVASVTGLDQDRIDAWLRVAIAARV